MIQETEVTNVQEISNLLQIGTAIISEKTVKRRNSSDLTRNK